MLITTILLDVLLLVEPESLFKTTLLIPHPLSGNENDFLSMLFSIFHFKPLFLVLEPNIFHKTV